MQRRILGWSPILIGVVGIAVAAWAALPPGGGADGTIPVVSATTTPAPDGNGAYRDTPQWYLQAPVTVHLHARDSVEVTKLYYSIDGGPATSATITPGPSVSADVRVTQQGVTQIHYWAVNSAGDQSVGAAYMPARGRGGLGGRGAAGRGAAGRGGAGRGAAGARGAITARGATAARGGRGAAAFGFGFGAPPAPPTLSVQAPAGADGLVVSSTTGLTAGQTLLLGDGLQEEAVTLASVVPPDPNAPAAPGRGFGFGFGAPVPPNVTLTAQLKNDHLAGDGFYQPYSVVSVAIDSEPPVATWPGLTDYKVMQSGTLTPAESDPRRRTADDTAQGSGGAAIWEMEVDGHHVWPKTQDLNTFTVGKHTETVEIHDVAGNARRYTLTFQVTTSLADLDKVLTEYADNAWTTTLAADAAVGDTGLQLTAPLGYRAGETLLIGSGSSQEQATIAQVASPPPRGKADLTLASGLQQAHAAGDTVSAPRPLIAPTAVTQLRALLSQAQQKADAGQTADAVTALQQFDAAVPTLVGDDAAHAPERAALTSAGAALVAQLQGQPEAVAGLGVTTAPGTGLIRVYQDPTPAAQMHYPGATYKVLVDGHVMAGNYRHESIVDVEAMIQKLGVANHFSVDIWDPPTTASPGRLPSPGISLTTSPFLSLATLKQYKTIVFDSSVGRDPTGTMNPAEFANFQAYIRGGGGFIAIHGGDDAYEDEPWYSTLDGAPFSSHGSNASGILVDCSACDEVELYNVDPTNPSTVAFPAQLDVHEELYNTSTNPVELDIVHPLVVEDESSLIGQLNVPNPGPLMNSDEHAMVWCHNFDGARSYTILLGHSWQFMLQPWYQKMVLGAIEVTSGQASANCSTYGEAESMLKADAASGAITADQNSALGQALETARVDYHQAKYTDAAAALAPFVSQTAGGSGAVAKLHTEGEELTSWMKEYSQRPVVDWGSAHLGPSSRPLVPGGPGQ